MNKRLLYACLLIVVSVILLVRCIGGKEKKDLRGNEFAGAEACISCHKSIYDSYSTTAHHNTSKAAADSTILGSFKSPDNIFDFTNGVQVKMESRDSGLFQAAYLNNQLQEARRFEMTIGSGRKAQTYLYFKGDQYMQLPLSYLVSAHNWANSPGFPASHPRFDRVVNTACFGCHTSKVEVKGIKTQGTG
ncbi:MAG: hypothetical protein EOO04_36370, partial [Chitinophagaceae bacterium]